MTITTIATLILIGLPGRADLRGTVTTPDGEQVSGALVVIDTAAVKKGTSPLCPSCYPDCGKRAETAADGSFEIKGLDADLTFRVLVIGNGYQSKQVKSVDPAKGPIDVQVERLDLAKLDPKRILRGVVLDPNGKPVVGASLEPESFKTDSYHGFSPGILDPLAVTNKNGEFVMTSKSPISYVSLRVKARDERCGGGDRLLSVREPEVRLDDRGHDIDGN